jgi:hypothetical protein
MFIDEIRPIGVDEYTKIIKTPHHPNHLTAVEQVNGDRGSLFSDLIEKLILDINTGFHYVRPYTICHA